MKRKNYFVIATFILVVVSVMTYFILNKSSYAYSDGTTYTGTTTENQASRTNNTTYMDFNDVSTIDNAYSSSVVFKAFDESPSENNIKTLKKPNDIDITTDSEKLRFTMKKLDDELILLLKDSAVNLKGELMDVVINVKVTGKKDDNNAYVRFTIFNQYYFIGQGKDQATFVPSNNERNNDQHITIKKGEPWSFGLGADSAHALFTITYYKRGTVSSSNDLTEANRDQNVSRVNSFFHDIDVPGDNNLKYLKGDEGIVPMNGASIIYYNRGDGTENGAKFPANTNSNSNIVKLVERGQGIAAGQHPNYTHTGSDGNDTDGIWYQSSAFMLTDNVSSQLKFMYGGTGCGIFFGFFSPYKYTLPKPEKTIVDKKDEYHVDDTFTYRVSQYVPNNYWGQELGFNSVYGTNSRIPETTKYTSFSITDNISDYLTINRSNIKVKNELGVDLTSKFTIGGEGQTVTATASSEALNDSSFYSHYVYLDIPVTVKSGIVIQNPVKNKATVTIDNVPQDTNEVVINLYYKLIVKHLEEGTENVLDDDTSQDKYKLSSGYEYETHKSSKAELTHVLVATPDNAIGKIVDKNVTVIYYYKKVEALANLYKQDSKTNKHVPGAVIEIYDESNKMIAKWTTQEDNVACNLAEVQNNKGCVVTETLKPSSKYTVKETKTPTGYATSEVIEFTTNQRGKIMENGQQVDGITVQNVPTRICIVTVDSNFVTIPGMKVELAKVDKAVENTYFTSTKNATCIDKVPVGDYTLDEVEVVGDYIKEDKKTITVEDTPKEQRFVIINQLKVPKTSLDSTKVLGIIAFIFAAFGLGAFGFVKYKNKKAK